MFRDVGVTGRTDLKPLAAEVKAKLLRALNAVKAKEQMSDNVKVVTDASFEADVLKSDIPVLVDFWAPWCGPCRIVAPVLEKVAARYEGRVTVAKLNVDENPETSLTYGIRSIPTIALFIGGEPVDGVMGAASEAHFAQMLDKHLATPAASETAS